VLSNLNIYIGDVFGIQFYISDVIGIALYFCDVCGLPKKASEIFEALIVSDVNEAAISVIMMLSNAIILNDDEKSIKYFGAVIQKHIYL
jgi:hypothetical protein